LPADQFRGLRFDPIEASGEVQLRSMRLLSSSGQALANLNPSSLVPLNQIASMTRHDGIVDIVTAPGATDPGLQISADCVNLATAPGSLMTVTPWSLTLVSAVVLAIVIVAVAAIGRSAMVDRPSGDAGEVLTTSARAPWGAMAALFLVIVAAKLLLMSHYPAPVPYLDQWDSEAQGVYIPYHEGCLSWRQMTSLHNEHRVFFTRLLALLTLVMNGQWDPVVQQVVNAMLHASIGVLLAAIFWLANGRRRPTLLLVIVGLMFGLPFGWENTLAPFQSAFYFLVFFSVLSIWLTDSETPGTLPWAVGWLCAIAALFTSAGGLMATLSILTIIVLRLLGQPRRWRESRLNIIAAVSALALGIATAAPAFQKHAVLQSHTSRDFLKALGANLAWPWVGVPTLAVLMWLPIAIVLLISLVRPKQVTAFERISLGIAAWTAMQAAAIAFARGAGGGPPAARYMDLFSIGFLVNAVACTNLAARVVPKAPRQLAAVAAAAWLSLGIVGLDHVTEAQLQSGAEGRRLWMVAYTDNLRRFIVTDDLPTLVSKTFPLEVPHWNPSTLGNGWLRHEYLRSILPPAVREPIRLQPESPLGSSFRPNGYYPTTPDPFRHAIGSFTELGNPAQGEFTGRLVHKCESGVSLQFEIAGYLGNQGLALGIRDSKTGRESRIDPTDLARERWTPATVPCSDGQLVITAVDRNPEFWFAFDEPVEVARGSLVAEYLIGHARVLLLVGLTLFAFCSRWR
jgi:hypothetical protein